MFIIRSIQTNDLEQLYALSALAESGLTTFPHDKEILKRRIKASVNSFNADPDRPGAEQYLFVLEDTDQKKIAGTCGIVAKVGGFEPFYTYEIKKEIHASKTLNVHKEIPYLQLIADHGGPGEIGTLFLAPEYRGQGLGRFLSLSRFLFMAQYPWCFEEEVLAELRGVIEENGRCPFWEALGRHFFDVEFQKADPMVMKDKSFIADLMPKYPIYIPLLTFEAQEVVGKVHRNTAPAKRLLESEGFRFYDQIDIFEAGPLVKAKVGEIRTVKESREAVVEKIVEKPMAGPASMAANVDSFKNFRVVRAVVQGEGNSVVLDEGTAGALGVQIGGRVRYVKMRAGRE